MLKRHDGRSIAARRLARVDGHIDPLQNTVLNGGKACRRGRAVRVGAGAGKRTATSTDERLHHGRSRRAKGHRAVGGAHKGRHAGGCLDHDSQGARPASSGKRAGPFRNIYTVAVEGPGITDQPGDRLGKLALLEGKDATVTGTECGHCGAIDGSLRITRPRWEFACILGHGVREGVDCHGDTVDRLGWNKRQATATE